VPEYGNLPVEAELRARLGQIVIKWTDAESLISWTVATFLMADLAAMSIVSGSTSISVQIKWIRALLDTHYHEDEYNKQVISMLDRAEELRQERNELVHGTWNSSKCEPGTCLVEIVNLTRREIIRSRLVTLHDLDDLASEIERWTNEFVALGRKLGFPRNRGQGNSIFAD
jgi:hypothetical protein